MQELQNKVIQWAEEKGIFEKSDPTSQFLKTISEVGELADAVNKNDLPEIKDAIGDTYVTIMLFAKMVGYERLFGWTNPPTDDCATKSDVLYLAGAIGDSTFKIISGREKDIKFIMLDMLLIQIARKYKWTAKECIQSAYDIISKRTGKMENGVFIKDV